MENKNQDVVQNKDELNLEALESRLEMEQLAAAGGLPGDDLGTTPVCTCTW